jgi:hypothetical protein
MLADAPKASKNVEGNDLHVWVGNPEKVRTFPDPNHDRPFHNPKALRWAALQDRKEILPIRILPEYFCTCNPPPHHML